MSEIEAAVDEALVHLCPDCGGHLGDTWDHDADECGRCGFCYVRIEDYGYRPQTSSHVPIKSMAAVVVGFICALSAGMVLADSSMVAQTESGVVITGIDGAFGWALLWGTASLLSLNTALWWSR
jgi:hypothetical protein